MWIPLALGALGVAALLYHVRPAGQFFFPRCSFHTLTGLLCPGCGGLRAIHDLLNARWLAALQNNALFVAGLPAAGAWWFLRRRQGTMATLTSRDVGWIVVAVVTFTLLRNLPAAPFTWLAPTP